MSKTQKIGRIKFNLEELNTEAQEICFWPIDNSVSYSIRLPQINEENNEVIPYTPKERMFIYEKDMDMEEFETKVTSVVNSHITTIEDVKKILRPGINRQLFDLKCDDKIIDVTACIQDLCKSLMDKYLEVDFAKPVLINATLHKFVYNKVLKEASILRTTLQEEVLEKQEKTEKKDGR